MRYVEEAVLKNLILVIWPLLCICSEHQVFRLHLPLSCASSLYTPFLLQYFFYKPKQKVTGESLGLKNNESMFKL